MTDIIVSVAEFKAHLSQILSESHSMDKRIIIMKRKKPIATVFPYKSETLKGQPAMGGLASVAGTWKELEEIAPKIDEAYTSRKKEKYREIPL